MDFALGLVPFHHGAGTSDASSDLVQRFVDSQVGTVVGAFLHTFGALLFTAGIALYLYQARLVRTARAKAEAPSLKLLPFAHGLNLAGISMNGVGGLMRLYQSDHPHIDQLPSSLWVQVLLVKHLFLILGIGLAVYLTYRTHILAQRDDAPANFFPEANRMTGFALTAFATILLASILGAVAAGQTLAMAGETQSATQPGTGSNGVGMTASVYYANATGQISGTPVMPGTATSSAPVTEGATELFVELTWNNPQAATLDLEVRTPDGKGLDGTKAAGTGRVSFLHNGTLASGSYLLVVSATRAVNEPYRILGRITTGPAPHSLEQTCNLPVKSPTGSGGFAEINLGIKLGQRFNYSWEVLNEGPKVDFNIHVHLPSRQVVNKVEGTWSQYAGVYVHDEPSVNLTSLFWSNPASAALKVHFRLTGDFASMPNSIC